MGNLIFQFIELLAFELHNLVAIIANDVVVVRVIRVIRIVNLVVLAEIHLVHEAALGEQWQRAIHRGAAHAWVAFACPFQQLLGGEMLVGAEHRLHNHPPLRGDAQIFLLQKNHELFLRRRPVRCGHGGQFK